MPHVIVQASRKWMCFILPPIISAGVPLDSPEGLCRCIKAVHRLGGHVSCLFGQPTRVLRAEGVKGSEELSLSLNIACLHGNTGCLSHLPGS